jgi:hypothetical protein
MGRAGPGNVWEKIHMATNESFDDAQELSGSVQDQRGSDERKLSSVDDAVTMIEAFRCLDANSPWTSLDRVKVADRLEAIVRDPRLLQQGTLNLCGPASLLHVWAGRDPVGFVRYATTLFDTGASTIGALSVRPTPALLGQDYAAMLPRMSGHVSPQADWMVMGALRNAVDVFWQPSWIGDPEQGLAGLTRPEELRDWLVATGIYATVRNEANWATLAGLSHAASISLSEGTDAAMLINTRALTAATSVVRLDTGTPFTLLEHDGGFILNQFPSHYVVLLSEVVSSIGEDVDQRTVTFSAWTWGVACVYTVPMRAFIDNYYGAVVATLAPAR